MESTIKKLIAHAIGGTKICASDEIIIQSKNTKAVL
jgi:hypothetical protein